MKKPDILSENREPRFGLSPRDMETIEAIFMRYPEVDKVCVFGSRAKGNYKAGSDIDLAVMNSGVSNQTILRIKAEFNDSRLPYKVDLVNEPELEHIELKEHIKRTGVLFYVRK